MRVLTLHCSNNKVKLNIARNQQNSPPIDRFNLLIEKYVFWVSRNHAIGITFRAVFRPALGVLRRDDGLRQCGADDLKARKWRGHAPPCLKQVVDQLSSGELKPPMPGPMPRPIPAPPRMPR
jgi:hypothetical protein